ncbi:MAG: carbohydrate kinase family protein [Paracoccaceae bacterium]
MTRRGIACAGNWIVDIVHRIDSWPRKSDLVHIRAEATGVGGGAANVALDLAAFGTGLPVLPVGLIGNDLHGQTVLGTVAAAGLPTKYLSRTDTAPTAHTHVMTVPGDSRTFFYHPGANDLVDDSHIAVEELAVHGMKLFYLGYINLMAAMDRLHPDGSTDAARVLARARAAGMVTCVDLVSADSDSFRATVAAALPHIDYLFMNEVEAGRATGLPVAGEDDRDGLLAAATALRRGGAGCVVIHTPALALWLSDSAQWQATAPADPARIVSPVGAGDAFCAGCLYGIHEGWPVERALTLAQRAATAALSGETATDGIPTLEKLMP